MYINTKLLSKNLDMLNADINQYSNTFNNYYHEMKNAENYANTNVTRSFFNKTKEENTSNRTFYDELLNLKKIYTYARNQYNNLGNSINFDLPKKENISQNAQSVKASLANIKRRLYSIDTYKCPELSYYVNNAITYINNAIEDVNNFENENKNKLNFIDNTERRISDMLKDLTITKITETDITPFM